MSTPIQPLRNIALALLALADNEEKQLVGKPEPVKDAYRGEGANAGYAVTERPQSEVERELQRLDSANAALGIAIDGLWQKLSLAVFQPAPDGGTDCAIEGCGSSLGSSIQHQALRTEASARNLRALTQSLAV